MNNIAKILNHKKCKQVILAGQIIGYIMPRAYAVKNDLYSQMNDHAGGATHNTFVGYVLSTGRGYLGANWYMAESHVKREHRRSTAG